MALSLEDGVAAITFRVNEHGTVDIAGVLPPEHDVEGDILRSIFVAAKMVLGEVVIEANKFVQQELEAEGKDVSSEVAAITDVTKR